VKRLLDLGSDRRMAYRSANSFAKEVGADRLMDRIPRMIQCMQAVASAYGPLPSFFTLYRATYRPKDWTPTDMTLYNFMSTSISADFCLDFIETQYGYKLTKDDSVALYRIRGPKGVHVAAIPFFALTRDVEYEMVLLPSDDIKLRVDRFQRFTLRKDIDALKAAISSIGVPLDLEAGFDSTRHAFGNPIHSLILVEATLVPNEEGRAGGGGGGGAGSAAPAPSGDAAEPAWGPEPDAPEEPRAEAADPATAVDPAMAKRGGGRDGPAEDGCIVS